MLYKKQTNRITLISTLLLLCVCAVKVLSSDYEYTVDPNGEIASADTDNQGQENLDDEEYYAEGDEEDEEDYGNEEYYKDYKDYNEDGEYDNDEEEYEDEDFMHSMMASGDYEKYKREDFDWRIHGTTKDLWFHLGCNELFKNPRPIHPQSVWEHARALYKSLAAKEDSMNSTLPDHELNGFSVDFEARQSPGKGRGIYATKDIQEGQLVYQSKQTARFDNGPVYRKFILGLEVGFACDVLQWAYVQNLGEDHDDEDEDEDEDREYNDLSKYKDLWVSVDLDEGCFCNDGSWDDAGSNVGCAEDIAEEFPGGCKSNFFALRDIKAGDELLCFYGDFAISNGWIAFGLMD